MLEPLVPPAADATTTEDEPGLITPTFVLIVAAGLCYFAALGMHLPVLPRYVEDVLDGSGTAVGIAVGAFAVSAAAVRPLVGRLGDRVGRRPLAVWGGLLAAVSVAGYGLVAALPALVGFRLLTGLGEAAFFVGVATAAQDLSPDDRRGEAASFFSIAIYGGLAIGPFIGEQLYDAHGADVVWIVSAALAATGALLATRLPAELGRADPATLAAQEAAAAADPRTRLQRWLHPAAVMPGTILLLGLMGFAAFGAFLALHLEDLGIDATGNLFLVYGLTVLVVRIVGAKIPDRFGAVRTTTVSLTAIIVAMVVIGTVDALPALYAGTIVFSIGMSLLFPALFGLVVSRAPASERSHAVGTFSLFFDLSQGAGAPLLGMAVDASGSDRAAFLTAAAIAAVGLVMARIRLPRATSAPTTRTRPDAPGPRGPDIDGRDVDSDATNPGQAPLPR